MKTEDFRSLALALPGAEERNHMHHPDFRVDGRIFATLGYPDDSWAMVRLYPDQQRDFISAHPTIFAPVKGAWGAQGCTNIRLASARRKLVQEALHAAWRNASVRTAIQRLEEEEDIQPLTRRKAGAKSRGALPARETA